MHFKRKQQIDIQSSEIMKSLYVYFIYHQFTRIQLIKKRSIFLYNLFTRIMKDKQYLFFLALIALVTCSNVVQLTDKNFNQTISANKYVMVKFYAPWCGHCKSMIPEYQKLADLAKDNGIIIGQLDATVQNQTAQSLEIQGFPTIKFYIDGVSVDYKGARTSDEMYGWIKTVTQKDIQQISAQKIQQLRLTKNFVVFFGTDSKKVKTIWLTNILDTVHDYFVNPSEQNKLVLYRVGKDSIQFSSKLQFSAQQIRNWALMNTLPTVVPLSTKQYLDWVFYDQSTSKDVAMLFRQSDVTQQTFKKFQTICDNNKDKFKCCVVDKTMEVYEGVKGYLKAKGNSILAFTKEQLKELYIYNSQINAISEQSWTQFLAEVSQRKHPNMASEQKEKVQYQHVKVLTDQNFTSFIQQNKLVFVQFYSPGCAHCVQFASIYDVIAKNIYENKQLDYQIAAIDLKANKKVSEQTKVTSFPTFRLYMQGEQIEYQGPRTEQSILSFIQTVKTNRPILAGSIAQVPSPSVVIYDSAQTSSLKLLPALFTRYPIYQIREGKDVKIVLRGEQQKTYTGQATLKLVSKWLHKETDPVLVDLLNPNLDNKLVEALQNKVSLLALIDVNEETSQAIRKTLENYCKSSTLVCGYAKKGQENFKQFTVWAGVNGENGSELLFINTDNFDKYLFPTKIQELNFQSLRQFADDVKEGKVKKVGAQQEKKEQTTTEQKQTKSPQQEKKQQQSKQQNESKQSNQQQQSNESVQSEQSEGDSGQESNLEKSQQQL